MYPCGAGCEDAAWDQLRRVADDRHKSTYRPPKANKQFNPILWGLLNCSFLVNTTGMMYSTRSVVSMMLALQDKNMFMFTHHPGALGSQFFLTGTHWKMLTSMDERPKPKATKCMT